MVTNVNISGIVSKITLKHIFREKNSIDNPQNCDLFWHRAPHFVYKPS